MVNDELNLEMKFRRSGEAPMTHAILANYNRDKNLTQQHAPRRIMEKLPKVTLA